MRQRLPDQPLGDLVDTIARDRRRRSWATVIAAAAGLCLLPSLLLLGFYSLEWWLLYVAPAIALVGGISAFERRPGPRAREALRYLRTRVLPHATQEMVPELLRLHGLLPNLSPDGVALPPLHETLRAQLPLFQPEAPLTHEACDALRHLTLRYHQTCPELCVAALLLLADAGDRSLAFDALTWTRYHPHERVREAAAEYLRATEKAP